MPTYGWKGRPISWREARRVHLRKRLWQKAAAFDKMPPTTLFAVFSPENPYARLRDNIYFAVASTPHSRLPS